MYAKDIIGLFIETNTVKDILTDRKSIEVADTMLLDNLMNHFIQTKIHIATVYDSFDNFIGIVTLEDVIEEIIKVEIVDELDQTVDMQHLALELSRPNILKE